MEEKSLAVDSKVFNRNKWLYSLGGIGRDMSYTLISSFFLTYIQYSGLNLSVFQFSVIGILLIVGRLWDAINDPMMGAIIEGSHFKWGKFKPWILIGAVLTAVVLILMFNIRPQGWNFVIFFGIIYLFWESCFTMNDISYWSMLPSLSSDPKQRNTITTMAVVFAGVGAFIASAIIPFVTTGNAQKGYSIISIVIAIVLVGCQTMTSVGVKENKTLKSEIEENISIKKMLKVIKGNDQLLWITLAMLLYNIGSGLLVALGYNFLYLEIGYNGTMALIFVATFGVCNIGAQAFYPKLVKKFSRAKLLTISLIATVFGYFLLLITGNVFFLPINIVTVCLFGVFVFSGQAIFYMILTVNLTNTIEYNEYKTGERNESVVFSLRPFMAKMASALQQGIVTLVLISTAIYGLSQNVSGLEAEKNRFDKLTFDQQQEFVINNINDIANIETYRNETTALSKEIEDNKYKGEIKANKEEQLSQLNTKVILLETIQNGTLKINEVENNKGIVYNFNDITFEQGKIYQLIITDAADSSFKDKATRGMSLGLRVTITLVPILLILGSYIVLKKRFVIDETKYLEMVDAIKARREEKEKTK